MAHLPLFFLPSVAAWDLDASEIRKEFSAIFFSASRSAAPTVVWSFLSFLATV
jgi:hypothetical protein